MILEKLCEYYQNRVEDPSFGLPLPGYSVENISHLIVFDLDGSPVSVESVMEPNAKGKLVPAKIAVPEFKIGKRSSGIAPNLLWDNSKYVLGLGEEGKPTTEAFKAFKKLNEEVFSSCEDPGVQAYLKFLEKLHKEPPNSVVYDHIDELTAGGSIVFKLKGDDVYLHERPAVIDCWKTYQDTGERDELGEGQCLVFGDSMELTNLHKGIKGVLGGDASGASLVTFNTPVYQFHQKKQGLNAPISIAAAFQYGSALNHLLSPKNPNRFFLAGYSYVFWLKEPKAFEEDAVRQLLGLNRTNGQGDEEVVPKTPAVYELLLSSKALLSDEEISSAGYDPSSMVHFLGMEGVKGRMGITFFHELSFGELIRHFQKHFTYFEITGDGILRQQFPEIKIITDCVKPLKRRKPSGTELLKEDRLMPELLHTILKDEPYPARLYTYCLDRVAEEGFERSGGYANYGAVRYGLMLSLLVRNYGIDEQEVMLMSLDKNSTHPGYLAGRYFAVLEYVQVSALPQKQNTIRSVHMGRASASPANTFGQLELKAAQHLKMIERKDRVNGKGKRVWLENMMAEIVGMYPNGIPAYLTPEERSLFMLGYYHQRNDFYTAKEKVRGNTSANILNGGLVASEGEWLYYANPSEGYCLYRSKVNGTDKERLNNAGSGSINVLDGRVYYLDRESGSVCRMKVDGTKDEVIFDARCLNLSLVDQHLYFINVADNRNVYRMKPDGKEPVCVVDVPCRQIIVSGGFIYYQSDLDDGIWKVKHDGRGKVKLHDPVSGNMALVGEWLFYEEATEPGYLSKVNVLTREQIQLTEGAVSSLNVAAGCLYYADRSKQDKLYKILADGTGKEEVVTSAVSSLHVVGGWLYYLNESDGKRLYRIHLNGNVEEAV